MNKITKGGVTLLAGMALAPALGGAAAHAQDTATQEPLAFKAGIYFPTNEDARAAGGDRMILFEAEYTLQTLVDRGDLIANTHLSLGFTERDELRIIPITLSQTFRDSRAAPNTGYYYGAGIGIYITRMESADTSGESKNLFGGFVVGGMNFGSVFGEVKYHLISRYDDKNVSGFQATIGTRF